MKAKKPKSMSFVDQGIYYGYPICCIKEFIQYVSDWQQGIVVEREHRQLNGTGYVPCAACNKKSVSTLLRYIKNHRQCLLPFPQQYKSFEEKIK